MKKLVSTIGDNCNLNEIYQSLSIKFAITTEVEDDGIYQLTEFFKCRDYLSDVLVSVSGGKSVDKIYGFKYNPSVKDPLWNINDSIQLMIECPHDASAKSLENSIWLLQKLEQYYGWMPSELHNIANKEYAFFLKSDKLWGQSTMMLSLLTLIIRSLAEDTVTTGNDTADYHLDDYLLKCSEEGTENNRKLLDRLYSRNVRVWHLLQFHDVIHRGANTLGNPDRIEIDITDTDTIHNRGGIASFADLLDTLSTGMNLSSIREACDESGSVQTALNYLTHIRS